MPRLKGLFILNSDAYEDVYGQAERAAIAEMVELVAPPQTAGEIQTHPELLRDVDVIFTGWGAPLMDAAFLAYAPGLRAVFYGAGSVRDFVTDAFWQRGILLTTAQAANAIPVADYTLATILFSLKRGWQLAAQIRREQRFPAHVHVPGGYGATIGVIGLGLIGRMVCERLRSFDLHVLAYDPYVAVDDAASLHVSLCSLDTLFQRAQVVTLHAPLLPETYGMIRGSHLASMPIGATFINTARGGVVRQDEMIAVLTLRPDLYAVLDVTEPEPPLPDSPLYTLPNVMLTPHIAGALGSECRRLGEAMVAELRRFVANEPLRYAVSQQQMLRMA